MKKLPIKKLDYDTPFDLETYMMLTQTKRIDNDLVQKVGTTWDNFKQYLSIYQLGDTKGYLLIYFSDDVEKIIDDIWDETPKEGFEQQCVAQAMIMSSVLAYLPEIGYQGCAPMPESNKILKRTLQDLNLEFHAAGGLNVKYGVLTYFPNKGSCDICSLKDQCPKRTMAPSCGDQGGIAPSPLG